MLRAKGRPVTRTYTVTGSARRQAAAVTSHRDDVASEVRRQGDGVTLTTRKDKPRRERGDKAELAAAAAEVDSGGEASYASKRSESQARIVPSHKELPRDIESSGDWAVTSDNGTPGTREDHPLLPHHDPQALRNFGSPVVGSSQLPFDASPEKLPQVHMRVLEASATRPPTACPRADPFRVAVGVRDELEFATCHAPERQGPWALSTVVLLRNVYLNNEGVVFNQSRVFNFDDCTLGTPEDPQPWHGHRKGGRVLHLRRAFSLAHHWGRNFFHNMAEVLPMFFALAAFLREDPSLPVLMKQNLYKEYLRYGERVTGIPGSKLNVVFHVNRRVQVLVGELIQPQYRPCMDPDGRALVHLRQHFFRHPGGLPFLEPSLRPRATPALAAEDMEGYPPDWKVALFLRPRGWARSLENEGAVVSALEGAFGRGRLVTLRRDLDIMEAMSLFQKTRLLVSVHGASLTNMLFLPQAAAVLEVRLTQYNLDLYEKMADRTGIRYFRTFAEGGKGVPVTANMTDVELRLGQVLLALGETRGGKRLQ